MRAGVRSHESLGQGPVLPALASSTTTDHRPQPGTALGHPPRPEARREGTVFRGILHFSEKNLPGKEKQTAGGVHHKEEALVELLVWQKDTLNHRGNGSHCPQTSLRAQDPNGRGGGSGADRSSLSSLSSVAQDATPAPAEPAPAQDPLSCESFSPSCPCPWGSRRGR